MKRRKKLIWQIFPTFLLITLLALIAVSWYASESLRQFYLDQAADDLRARAILLSKLVVGQLSPPDAASVDSICKTMGRLTATRFTVILTSGEVIGDSIETPSKMDNHAGRPEIMAAISGKVGASMRYSDTLLQEMLYVAAPVVHNERTAAVIRASLPVTIINGKLKSIRLRILIGGFIIALVAAGVSLIISRRISRPLETMKKSAKRFADGDLNHRLAAPNSEELAGLADAMNRMAAQLNARINTIVSQRNELETILASMLEGVIAVDTNEHVISMNPAATGWFNINPAAYQNRSVQEIIRNIALQHFIGRALASTEPLQEDITLHRNDERILNVKSAPLMDADRKQVGVLVVFSDVTQLRRLENMRREFVANVSHEIKTPLTAIKGFVETLHHGNVDTVEAGRFFEIIQKHVDRLNSIVEDLLTLSRIEQENKAEPLNRQPGNIIDVFHAAAQICGPTADEKNIRIDMVDDDRCAATFDSTLLEQAVINLLDNAIKYSNPGSTVRLRASKGHSEILVSVIDQGIGVEKKHLPRLFERFYRVDKSRSRQLGGTGLGLAIVKHIAQVHEGYVTVESAFGAGSTFTIHLPKYSE